MSVAYSGSLQAKKKAELQEIAQALAITDAGTREDLQQRIKKHLEDYSGDLETDPAFSGLYTARKRQRSLQPPGLPQPTHSYSTEPSKFTAIPEERGFTPPADDRRDVSMMIPRAPLSPGLPTPSPPRKTSPRNVSLPPTPAKSVVVEAKVQPEVQAALEMEWNLVGSLFQTMSSVRTFLSSGQNIFALSSFLDFVAILYNIHANSFFPIPPVYVNSEPALRATALATMYWAIPSILLPVITGYLVSFSSPASQPHFDVLSASIVRMAANFANFYPSMVFVERDTVVQSLDVLGIKWRVLSSGVSLAFAFAEAVAGKNRVA